MRSHLVLAAALLVLLTGTTRAQEPPDPKEEISAFFETLGAAFRSADADRISRLIDAERMFTEMKSFLEIPGLSPQREEAMLMGLRLGLRLQAPQWGALMGWVRHEIVKLELREDRREATIVLRNWDETGFSSKLRWWLIRSEEGWRFYDFEDLSTSLRICLVTATMLSTISSGEETSWLEPARKLVQACILIAQGETESGAALMDEILEAELPDILQALKHTVIAALRIDEWEHDEALVHIAEARKHHPDMPILFYLESVARNFRGEHEQALLAARQFMDLIGEDGDARLEEGRALLMLDRRAEAVGALRQGLEQMPDSIELLAAYGAALHPGEKKDFLDRFAALEDPPDWFETLILEVQAYEDRETERALIAKLREIAPGDPNADFYEAEVLWEEGRHEEAAKMLLAAIPRAPSDEKPAYVDAYLGNMVAGEAVIEGYLALRTQYAFDYLAEELDIEEDGEILLELVNAHAERAPESHRLAYYRGQAHHYLEEWDLAEEAYLRAVERGPDDDEEFREEVRSARVFNLYSAGQWLVAYAKIGPRRPTFDDLATYCSLDEDAEALAFLIAAHRTEDPEDPALRFFEAEALWLAERMEEMVETLLAHRETITKLPDYLEAFEDRLVRGLIRLDRLDEALAEAKRSTARDGDPWFEALVHAAAGRPEELEKILTTLRELGYDENDFQEDEILGPALREKHPPPK